MSQETQIQLPEQYLPQPAAEPTDAAPEGGPKGNPLLKVLASARRHWLMVLLVWVFVGAPGAAAVWFMVKPAYTASGFVKVEPTTAILFPDVDAAQQDALTVALPAHESLVERATGALESA